MYKEKYAPNTKRYSKKELLENIKVVWDYKKSQPLTPDMSKYPSEVSFSTYFSRFGSWTNAIKEFVKYANSGEVEEELANVEKKNIRKSLSKSMRYDILNRDNFKCVLCGDSPAISNTTLEVDHIVPVSKGGGNSVNNLRTLCKNCNIGKFNKHID